MAETSELRLKRGYLVVRTVDTFVNLVSLGAREIVLRQFHVKGFVNQYVLESITQIIRKLCLLRSTENNSNSWRARETYKIETAEKFTEMLELAAPGKKFEVCVVSWLKRGQSAISVARPGLDRCLSGCVPSVTSAYSALRTKSCPEERRESSISICIM